MILSLKIRVFLNQYRQKLEPPFASAEIGLEQEIKILRLADNTTGFPPSRHTEARR